MVYGCEEDRLRVYGREMRRELVRGLAHGGVVLGSDSPGDGEGRGEGETERAAAAEE